jgi:hypothetical protein
MEKTTIAVDLEKSVFEVAVSERPGSGPRTAAIVARTLPAMARGAAAGNARDGSVCVGAPLGPTRARVDPVRPSPSRRIYDFH